jgi:DNA-directed RNA polymerase subunit RPC12/RpoP
MTTHSQICPDCGGTIGGERTGSTHPCTCPITPPQASSASADTIDEREGEPSRKRGKHCIQCGKPLEGHRRFKDSLGYWCKDCHRKDKAQHTAPETRCPDCGRMRPIESMVQFESRTICPTCLKEAQLIAKRKANRAAAEAAHIAHERRTLYIMLSLFALLCLVLLYSLIKRHLHH